MLPVTQEALLRGLCRKVAYSNNESLENWCDELLGPKDYPELDWS